MTPFPDIHSPEKIYALDRPQCQELWRSCFGTTFPRHLSLAIAKPILAFELQACATGGLDRQTKTALKAAAARRPGRHAPTLKAGSQLVREWNGVTHRVEVLEDGFAWQGKTWRSLSAIAKAITGAHWSGPRFFGLKAQRHG